MAPAWFLFDDAAGRIGDGDEDEDEDVEVPLAEGAAGEEEFVSEVEFSGKSARGV
jgi:hypothetical protein